MYIHSLYVYIYVISVKLRDCFLNSGSLRHAWTNIRIKSKIKTNNEARARARAGAVARPAILQAARSQVCATPPVFLIENKRYEIYLPVAMYRFAFKNRGEKTDNKF